LSRPFTLQPGRKPAKKLITTTVENFSRLQNLSTKQQPECTAPKHKPGQLNFPAIAAQGYSGCDCLARRQIFVRSGQGRPRKNGKSNLRRLGKWRGRRCQRAAGVGLSWAGVCFLHKALTAIEIRSGNISLSGR